MIKQFIVINDQDNMRIDKWLRKNNYNLPQGLIEKLLRNGKIKVNSKKIKSSHKVREKDLIKIFNVKENISHKLQDYTPSKSLIKQSERGVIFDNDDYIVINKEAGVPVQGGTKSKKNLITIFSKSNYFENAKPFTVHRLDKDTSGIILIAKNRKSAQFFTSLFRIRKIYKTYIALCVGYINNEQGIWEHKLEKIENNKKITEKAISKFKVIDKNSNLSLIELKPITGRKHQLRKQTFNVGHPIYGDNKYGENNFKYKKLFLHSYEIKFIKGKEKFNYIAPLPEYFKKILLKKKINFSNYL